MLGFVALFLLGVFLLWLYALISCLTRPGVDSGLRIVWFLVIFFLPLFGPLLFIFVGPKANSSATIAVTNNTSSVISDSTTITPTKGMSTGGKVALIFGCIFMLIVIGVPIASVVAVRSFGFKPVQTVTKRYSTTQTWDLSGKKQASTSKDIQSLVRNIAVSQEAYYVDQEHYASCVGSSCAMILPGIALKRGQYVEVTTFKKGRNDEFIVEAWDESNPESKVVWDTSKGGMQ